LKLNTATDAFHLDFMARTVAKNGAALPVQPHDALRAELADLLNAARNHTKPRVSAGEARAAMRVAWRILEAITS
jgi:predicted dehydrogenase